MMRLVIKPDKLQWERPLTMRSGMYNFGTQEPVLLLDEAGNPYTDAVEIPVK